MTRRQVCQRALLYSILIEGSRPVTCYAPNSEATNGREERLILVNVKCSLPSYPRKKMCRHNSVMLGSRSLPIPYRGGGGGGGGFIKTPKQANSCTNLRGGM